MKNKYIARAAALLCAAAIAVSAATMKQAGAADISASFKPVPELAAAVNIAAGNKDVGENTSAEGIDTDTDNKESAGAGDEAASAPGLSRLPGGEDNSSSDSGESRGELNGRVDSNSNNSGGRTVAPDSPSAHDRELPGDEPEDGGESEENLFTTSIRSGEHVSEPEYSFTINHLNKSYKLRSLIVSVNGRRVQWSGTVTLSDDNGGRNMIRVDASYTDVDGMVHSGYREYTVWLDVSDTRTDGDSSSDSSNTSEKDNGDGSAAGSDSTAGNTGSGESSDSEAVAGDDSFDADGDSEKEIHEPKLVTDLSSLTTSEEELSFTAYIDGGDSSELKVYLGGSRLYPDGDEYRCVLGMGLNTIRLKAAAEWNGESYDLSESFEIRRIAETTPETAPRLSYQNVPQQVRGDVYTLDLIAQDCSGSRIYDNGITVLLNGSEIKCGWIGEYTSYLLHLTGGDNTLDIRVTDGEGRYSDYSYVIVCTWANDGDVIGRCSISIDAKVLGLGELTPQAGFEIKQGETAIEAISGALANLGFTAELRGSYIARIYKDGMAAGAAIPDALRTELQNDGGVKINDSFSADSLGERDFTSLSGWVIAVNGHYISYGAQDLHLKDGDTLQLRFTLAAGKDIGDGSAGDLYENTY